ncbi:MAG: 23S rRNA pseudouridine(1911/1915/1917) synthase RluD [Nitrosomonas sp.]|nr:23S rRNA pseudouridine(1911/1915/1917) synthase RluD [Nitrosomonas sp.]
MSHIKSKQFCTDYNVKRALPMPIEQNYDAIDLDVPGNISGLRLDQVLARLLPQWSRSRLQGWIKQDRISVDGITANTRQKIWGGERIRILPDLVNTERCHHPEAIPLNIVYEDCHLLVIDKPAGLVVHPGNGNWQGTMLNALLSHAERLSHVPRAGIVHRLDKETSGLLVVAKTIEAQLNLVRQLQQRSVNRDYLAIVQGDIRKDGVVDAPIGRHPKHRTRMAVIENGKPARTYYYILEKFQVCTLLRCSLETGRTHQIRVHLRAIGHPLAGDPVYGGKLADPTGIRVPEAVLQFPRQALHAQRLELTHPHTGQRMQWNSPIPHDLAGLLRALRSM